MNVAVIAPWRPGAADRERLWDFCRAWWADQFPAWPITAAPGPTGGPFNRSAAINDAAAAAGEWDVAVIIDTDVIPDARSTASAVQVAAATGQMVVAHDERVMLNRNGTAKVLGGFTGSWRAPAMVDKVWPDSVSCCVAVPRALWDAVGGFDPLFVGWGREDTAFRIACEAVAQKPIVKLGGETFHLWHPPAAEVKHSHPLRKANEARHQRYVAARWDVDAVRRLLDEARTGSVAPDLPATRIPRILHRTVPADTSPEVEAWWDAFAKMHPSWDLRTYREPVDPNLFPQTSRLWAKCKNGAQKAGLIRLEALVTWGGVYVDSDVEPIRPLDPLLHLPAFAGWEDETTVPDAVLGAEPGHPAFVAALTEAKARVKAGRDAWTSGPGVTTKLLPGRVDVLVLPPGAFFPHHYLEKSEAGKRTAAGWVFAEHKWHHSWGSEASKADIASRQR